ncbi:hypothetical protein, partial [Priestia megaterium]|uniref:hypothetical protein n=1 Tax=Priestia megaterium TaxID=1404 RepID=UPI0035B68F54
RRQPLQGRSFVLGGKDLSMCPESHATSFCGAQPFPDAPASLSRLLLSYDCEILDVVDVESRFVSKLDGDAVGHEFVDE